MADDPTLTIFTPAYNRAGLLPRLFASIKAQVAPGDPMEWLVIDDGSKDDTPAVLAAFAAERPDLVRCVRVANGGKHRAINRAADAARGQWVMIVDSDDRLAAGAVAQVLKSIAEVGANPAIGALRALKRFPELSVEHHLDVPRNPCRHIEWCSRQHTFDTAEVIRRDALQLHPFPDFAGERFMAEGWLWHELDKTHLTFFVDSPWVECFYQEEGLSASSRAIRANSPYGAMAVYAAMVQAGLPLRGWMRSSINWWRYRFHARSQRKPVGRPAGVSAALSPLGWLMYRYDRWRLR